MKKVIFSIFLMSSMILTSCGGGASNENQTTKETSIDGIDYRPILGKNYNSDEVRLFFIENKISPNKEYLKIKLDNNKNIEEIFFREKCPPQSMPYGSSFLLTQRLTKKKYGKPSLIIGRTFVYKSLNLAIQFSINDPNNIDDIGVFSDKILEEIKSK